MNFQPDLTPRDRDRSPEPAVSCLAPTPMVLSPPVWPLTASSVDRAKPRPSRAPDSSPGGRRGSTARPFGGRYPGTPGQAGRSDHDAAPGQSSSPPIARHALPATEALELALSSSAATPKTEAGPQAFPSPSERRAGAPVDRAVTVRVASVWAVTSDRCGWFSGWRRADSSVLRRLAGLTGNPSVARRRPRTFGVT
jgi:hypothetical protein